MDYSTYQKIGKELEDRANYLANKSLDYFVASYTLYKDDYIANLIKNICKNLKIKDKTIEIDKNRKAKG
jgi:hypothetical protein